MKKRQIDPFGERDKKIQELADFREATLNLTLAKIPDITTFGAIGDLIGVSYEWVRVRLTVHPERLLKYGKRYKVPKGVAEDFIRSAFV